MIIRIKLEKLNFQIANIYNEVAELLSEGRCKKAQQKIESVSPELQTNTIIEYIRAVCNKEVGNTKLAIKQLTYLIDKDPGFVSAVELILALNKSSYLIGELKYFYELILFVKPENIEMWNFVEKYKDVESIFNKKPNFNEFSKRESEIQKLEEKKEIKSINALVTQIHKNKNNLKSGSGELPKKNTNRKSIAIMLDEEREKNKNPNTRSKKNKTVYNINNRIAEIETLTIAKLYIKQGFYKEALDILYKIKKRDNGKNVSETIDEVKKLIQHENVK
ncbi:MAG: hypothetical protein U9N76_01045 [Candidatus Marinimicrobia bacterium]|nr:hypothetical protein [Candidatus Neomarinimicrobiota bacterium]